MKSKQKIRRKFINPVYKDKVVVLKTSEETNGEFSFGKLEVSPGGGNYMHVHSAFEETFTAMKGTLGVAIRKKRYYLNPGESVTILRKTPHHFFDDGNQAALCHVKFVAGHEGFQKGLAIAFGLASDNKTDSSGKPRILNTSHY